MILLAAALALADGSIEKKGLQIQMVPDAIALGVRQAGLNVSIADYLRLPQPGEPRLPGTNLALNEDSTARLGTEIDTLRRARARIWIILLARESGRPEIDRDLMHPRYDPACPNKLSAFNVETPAGRALLAGFTQAITERFPQKIDGWIVGNEVNSHYYWSNMGPATAEQIADNNERALRIVWNATKTPIYLSLEHHWTIRYLDDPTKTAPGRDILEGVARRSRERGDFPWRVAFHPYPENLFEPRFWIDKSAPLSFDAPRVTFKNLEVLTEFLKRREMRYRGLPRQVNLSEQGFHRPDTADGETIQAAAYAYAWNRVKRNPGIEGFILNRHVDHAHEGGLLLGLWTKKDGTINEPGRKTRMWEVFEACGTPREAAATAFALPIVGLRSWNETGPKPIQGAK